MMGDGRMSGSIDTVLGVARLLRGEPFVYDGLRAWAYELVGRPGCLYLVYDDSRVVGRPACYGRSYHCPPEVGGDVESFAEMRRQYDMEMSKHE